VKCLIFRVSGIMNTEKELIVLKIKPKTLTLAVLMALSLLSAVAALRVSCSEPEPIAQEAAEFYLRDCEGYIAVYRGVSATPAEVTEIETATLNDTDAKLILEGIPVMSRNELLLLLEDLGS